MPEDSLQLKTVKIDDFEFDKRNANLGTERGQKALEKSLFDLGAGRSIVVDKNLKVIGGNKTLEAYSEIGFKDVVVIPSNGKHLIAIQRTDLSLDEDERARLLSLSDNRVGELSLSWDVELLQADVDILGATNLWDESELALLQDDFDLAAFEGLAQGESVEETEKKERVEQSKIASDLLPFHVLLSVSQRERLYEAIKEAKTKGAETTAEALDVIVQDYLNAD